MKQETMLNWLAAVNFTLFTAHFVTGIVLAAGTADKLEALRTDASVKFGLDLLILDTPSSGDYEIVQEEWVGNETLPDGLCEGNAEALAKKRNGLSFLQPVASTSLRVDFYGCLQFFNFKTAFFHLFYGFLSLDRCGGDAWSKRMYPRKFLKTGINTMRWAEYALTAPPMLLITFQLFGMLSQTQAFTTLLLTSLVMLLGGVFPDLLAETQSAATEETSSAGNTQGKNETDASTSPRDPALGSHARDLFFISSLVYLIAWLPLIISFATLFSNNSDVPRFLVWIFITQFGLFSSFAAVRFYHFYRSWKIDKNLEPTEYFWIEMGYLFLSVSSKLLLTFIAEQNIINKPFLQWGECS